LRICRVASSRPRPKPSTPALFDTTVRSFTPLSRSASISASGMPHRPKPPTASNWPSRTMPARAAAALEAREGEVVLALPVAARHVHEGGVLCGQTMMAAADTAMVLAVMTKLGGFKPMTTVQMNTSFLRPVGGASGEVRIVARVLRMGRSLVFGEIQLLDAKGELAAHATTTYALL
jgi:uncharacterized protein (TIGR00369 family)